jgi:hypothetical protein
VEVHDSFPLWAMQNERLRGPADPGEPLAAARDGLPSLRDVASSSLALVVENQTFSADASGARIQGVDKIAARITAGGSQVQETMQFPCSARRFQRAGERSHIGPGKSFMRWLP